MHIAILQFVILAEQQVAEEANEEQWFVVYAFCQIAVVGSDEGIAEVP